jgi:hypothetical protein
MQTYIYMWSGSKRKKETGANFVVIGSFHTKLSWLAFRKTNLYYSVHCIATF